MPTAIQLHFDHIGDKLIRDAWSFFASRSIPSRPIQNSHYPHITICYGEIRSPNTFSWPRSFPNHSFSVTFDKIDTFGISSGVIFLSVQKCSHLFDLNNYFDQNNCLDKTDSLYKPIHWMPHCSLATRLSPAEMSQALVVSESLILPITTKCVSLNLVTYPASSILKSIPLIDLG